MRSLTPGFFVCLLAGALAAPASAPAAPADSVATPTATVAAVPAEVAATLAGRTITLDEVDRRAAAQLMRVRQEQYEARAQALDAILDQEVLQREADAKHVAIDRLIETEVAAKQTAPTPAEIDTFFVQNRGQMGGRTLEQSAAQITEALRNARFAEARSDFVRALRRKYDVRVALEPPRFAVSVDDDPARGPAKAPVTIVEFSDFQCPYCDRAERTIDQVLEKYGDRVRLVFRDFPLSIHPDAENAAVAANCALAQGKYWPMNRAMFANSSKLSLSDLAATAVSVGLDVSRFRACMESDEARAEVRKDVADGQALGLSGTPTFFVNGVMIVGAREADVFTRAIDRELERLKQ
jgi:protein-disulfide isomerase